MIVHFPNVRIAVIFHLTIHIHNSDPQIVNLRIIVFFYIFQKTLRGQQNIGMAFQVRNHLFLKFIIKDHARQHHCQAHTEHRNDRHVDVQFSFHIVSIFSAGHLALSILFSGFSYLRIRTNLKNCIQQAMYISPAVLSV